jgi:hypothetical protein
MADGPSRLESFTGSVVEASHPASSVTEPLNNGVGHAVDCSECSDAPGSVNISEACQSHAGVLAGGRPPPTKISEGLSTTSSMPEVSRKTGRGASQNRRSSRKLQVAHFMAKPVTALLFVENMADSKSADVRSSCGFVWWWTKGGCMHVHDVQSNNTSTKVIPPILGGSRSTVRVLALDLSQVWVWAGHDDGYAFACCTGRFKLPAFSVS